MRVFKLFFALIVSMVLTFSCKKKEASPDPYAFLNGTWKYSNGAECVFDAASKTAKGTKVPTNDLYGFVVGEDYWRNVVLTSTGMFEYDQIVRYSDKKTVEYRKSKMSKKDENTLSMSTPGLSDSEMKRVLP
jgi:uncharacterized lipoprotein YehR (DUF1307 family)